MIRFYVWVREFWGSVLWFSGKESAHSAGDAGHAGSIPQWRRSAGEESYSPLQYSRLQNPTDREAWRATVLGVAKSQTGPSGWTIRKFWAVRAGGGERPEAGRWRLQSPTSLGRGNHSFCLSSFYSVCVLPYRGLYALKMLGFGDFNSGAV